MAYQSNSFTETVRMISQKWEYYWGENQPVKGVALPMRGFLRMLL